MDWGSVHQNQVGAFAWFERASDVADVERLRAHAGRHQQGGCGRDNGRVIAGGFRHKGGEAHFLEHIEVVVRGGTIRADAHVESVFEHLLHGGKSRSQFEVRRWVVRHACIHVLQTS